MADSPVNVAGRAEVVQGQAQAGPREPHDGKHFIEEVAAVTDRVITDVKDALAVQVPEGVGASHAGHRSPLGQALARGTVEDQLAANADESAKADTEQQDVESGKTTSQPEAESAKPAPAEAASVSDTPAKS